MKKIRNVFLSILTLLITLTYSPLIVLADSGLDSKFESDNSMIGAIMNAISSCFTFVIELIKAQPGDKEYASNHIVLSIICIITFYIFTNIYIFKLDRNKPKKSKKVIALLSINLIPTTVFSIICLLTNLQLILYIFILVIYIIILKIVIERITKNKLQAKM